MERIILVVTVQILLDATVLSQHGEPLDLSSGAFSLEEDGSLHIASPGGNESGEFVCTATNAAGYSSRKVQLTVYG